MTNIVMSIRPCWWAKILNQAKTLEIRKSAPKAPGPYRVYMYVSGTGKIFGYVDVDEVFHATAKEIHEAGGSCLTMDQLNEYADGRMLRAWNIQRVVLLRKPVEYKGRPPMSWTYVPVLKKSA